MSEFLLEHAAELWSAVIGGALALAGVVGTEWGQGARRRDERLRALEEGMADVRGQLRLLVNHFMPGERVKL